MQDINWFDELFLSTEIWGYFGVVALVVIGYLVVEKNKPLGIIMFIIDSLVAAQYLELVVETPDYWWHIFILILGIILCTAQMAK